jgi:hypothetical protein
MTTTLIRRIAAVALTAAGTIGTVSTSHAVPVTWADWTQAGTTSAIGTIGAVGVSFSGALSPAAQTAGGIDYWAVNPAIYTAPGLDNGPSPNSDIIRLTGGTAAGTQTLTFSAPVTNPLLAIMSLGQPGFLVTYDFDAPFTILNSGTGFWGGSAAGSLFALPGDVLQGNEGHGLIQFQGTFTSISWTIPTAENWHGFQVGLAGPASTVPEPGTLLLIGLMLASLGLLRLKRSRV